MRRLAILVTMLVMVTTLVIGPGSVGAQNTLVVDDDGAQCPSAGFSTISAAVAAAGPGDTIEVCPGLYQESVVVDKSLRLEGSGPNPQARTGDPATESILAYPASPGLFGFTLAADGVELRGFTIQPAAGSTTDRVGIYTDPAFSGYRVEQNLVRNNTFGLYLNASGALPTVVRGNAFVDNTLPGSASGNGIYSDQGLSNARVEGNFFTGNSSAGIVMTTTSGSITGLVLTHNTSVGDGSFAAIFNTSGAQILHNQVEGTSGSGLFIGSGNTGLLVRHNRLENGAANGIRVNADPGIGGSGAIVTNAEISHNTVRGMTLSGISAAPDSMTGTLVSHNRALRNGVDGVRVGTNNTSNTFQFNVLLDNAEHDAHDDSFSDNTWTKNQCRTDNQSGAICR